MELYLIFCCGVFGGCSPEILRIQRIMKRGGLIKYKNPRLYVLISIIMALFGGVLAIAFESPNILNAIWIGASTPLIISNLAKVVPS